MTGRSVHLAKCPKAGDGYYHNWFCSGHNLAWTILQVFCNRCGKTIVLTQRQHYNWYRLARPHWYGVKA